MVAASTAPGHPEIARLVAPNPGPMTLDGTNSYVVGRDPAYVVDPGPDEKAHIDRLRDEAERRGGLGGVLVTHSHADHTDGVARLGGERLWGEPGAIDEASALARAGPFTVIPTPGHAADHVCFVLGRVCFCGDLILGEGSSIVPPAGGGGSVVDYMASLERLAALDLELICPGHGPWITDPAGKIAEYRRHRADRESKLVAALDSGERSRARLLDLAWDDVPSELRPAAALAMQAHLEKLAAEGRPIDELAD